MSCKPSFCEASCSLFRGWDWVTVRSWGSDEEGPPFPPLWRSRLWWVSSFCVCFLSSFLSSAHFSLLDAYQGHTKLFTRPFSLQICSPYVSWPGSQITKVLRIEHKGRGNQLRVSSVPSWTKRGSCNRSLLRFSPALTIYDSSEWSAWAFMLHFWNIHFPHFLLPSRVLKGWGCSVCELCKSDI